MKQFICIFAVFFLFSCNKFDNDIQKINSQVEKKEIQKTKKSSLSGKCPSLVSGFDWLKESSLTPLYKNSNWTIFEVLCQSEEEKEFTNKLWWAENSLLSMIWYDFSTKKITVLPVFSNYNSIYLNNTDFKKYITSSEYKSYVIGISPESTKNKEILDIIYLWNSFLNGVLKPEKIGQIEWEYIKVYWYWIAYKKLHTNDLRFFNFSLKKDKLLAKNVEDFVLFYKNSNVNNKIFKEGWNILYYTVPDELWKELTPEEENSFKPKNLDIKFYTFNNWETKHILILKSKTKVIWWMWSYIGLSDSLIKWTNRNSKTIIYFWDKKIY